MIENVEELLEVLTVDSADNKYVDMYYNVDSIKNQYNNSNNPIESINTDNN